MPPCFLRNQKRGLGPACFGVALDNIKFELSNKKALKAKRAAFILQMFPNARNGSLNPARLPTSWEPRGQAAPVELLQVNILMIGYGVDVSSDCP
jgi:hypothetical protein